MKHLKKFKLFESSNESGLYSGPLEDNDEDNLVARSNDWNLYAFNSLHEYVKLESRLVSESDVSLTKGPFSHATQKYRKGESLGDDVEGGGLNKLFQMYYDRFGKLYLLINMETSENYMFNANKKGNYTIFDRFLKSVKSIDIIPTLKSLDFLSDLDEQVITSMTFR